MTVVAPRADARRNRARLLDAAAAAFRDDGLDVSLTEIARRAGVGAGTAYRHFPVKELLVEAVLARSVDEMAATEQRWQAQASPEVAFFGFLTEVITRSAARRDLCHSAPAGHGWPRAVLAAATHRFERTLAGALADAQRHGVVRGDVDVADLSAIVLGCVTAEGAHPDPVAGARVTRLVLDGLRVTKDVTKPVAVATARCGECGAWLTAGGTGRPRRYCDARCRQRAHRRRRSGT